MFILAGCQYDSAGKSWVKTPSVPSIKTTKAMPIQETRTIFRCWYAYSGVANHYLSFNSNCEGNNVDGIIGHLYTTQKSGTQPIYQCYRQTRHDRKTFTDHFTSLNQNCEGQKFDKILGYAPITANPNTANRYRCWSGDSIRHGKFDHMLSADYNCEGFTHREQTYFFLKQPIYREECTGDVKDYLENNQQKTYIAKGIEYDITAMIFNNQVKFRVNGEITEALGAGDHDILADGAKIQADQINQGKGASFCLTAGKIQTMPVVILVNDVAPASDVILATEISTILNNNPYINVQIGNTKLDSEVRVYKLNQYELIVRILHGDVNLFYADESEKAEQVASYLENWLSTNKSVIADPVDLEFISVRDLAEIPQS